MHLIYASPRAARLFLKVFVWIGWPCGPADPHKYFYSCKRRRREASRQERFCHEPLELKPRGLSLPLRANLFPCRLATERDNRLHDDSPRDIDGRVVVRRCSVSTGLAQKLRLTLTIGFFTVSALMTDAGCIARMNDMQLYTSQSGFIGEELAKLPKGPGTMARALRPSNRAFRPRTDVSKVLYRYSLFGGLRFPHNMLTDDMVGIAPKSGLSTGELLEATFSGLGTTLLQACPQGVHLLAVLFHCFTATCLAFAIGGKIDNAQIDTKYVRRLRRFRDGHIQRYCEIKRTLAVYQVRLPFNGTQASLLIAADTKGHQHTPLQGQQRDFIHSLEGHHPLIVGDSAFTAKCWLD